MSKDLNSCNFIGRLGKDVDMRSMPNGDQVANFSLAVGDDYRDKQGQKHEKTEWVRVVAFRKLAEIIGQYLRKGSKVYISGKMQTSEWEKDGIKRYSTEILANEMIMLDGKSDSPSQQPQDHPAARQPAPRQDLPPAMDDFDDDIPF